MIKLLSNLLLLWTGLYVQHHAAAQSLSLDECHTLARSNYPLIKKLDLIARSTSYSLENVSKLYLPQVNVTGQASYQSQTVSFSDALGSATLPGGLTLPNISKDQYKIQAELTQTIYDGDNVNNQRAYIAANQNVQQQSVEVALYGIYERVDQIFFAILLMDEQMKQNSIRQSDLQGAADKTAAALKFGNAFRSSLDQLTAELIQTEMTATEIQANRSAYLKMLATLIGKVISPQTTLEIPATRLEGGEVIRPELKLYDFQRLLIDREEQKLKTDYMPKLNAFVQGAYGRPSLNFISNKFGAWYLAGLRLNWNLASLYTLKNNRQILEINRKNIETDRANFLLNTDLSITQQDGDIGKYQQLIEQDERVIVLRNSVKKSATAQLENGVITTHDYISQINAENQARQTQAFHKMQLLQAQYKKKHLTGN